MERTGDRNVDIPGEVVGREGGVEGRKWSGRWRREIWSSGAGMDRGRVVDRG
jgi:hypothetical protein